MGTAAQASPTSCSIWSRSSARRRRARPSPARRRSLTPRRRNATRASAHRVTERRAGCPARTFSNLERKSRRSVSSFPQANLHQQRFAYHTRGGLEGNEERRRRRGISKCTEVLPLPNSFGPAVRRISGPSYLAHCCSKDNAR